MMKKTLLIMAFLISAVVCCSCMLLLPNIDEMDETERVELVFSLIEAKDFEGFKELFSEKALQECPNIDIGINYLFELLDGIESWKKLGSNTSESNKYGTKRIIFRPSYQITTVNGTYKFWFKEYIKDDENPENVGIYSVLVYPADNDSINFDTAGIYIPTNGTGGG